jgi:hypothetical protein
VEHADDEVSAEKVRILNVTLGVLQALQPDIIGFRWKMHSSVDSAESYGNLTIICPNKQEMDACEFHSHTITREVMDALQNVLYHAQCESIVVMAPVYFD